MWLKTVSIIFLILLSAGLSAAADDLSVKISHLPVDNLKWGSGLDSLKSSLDNLACEYLDNSTVECSHTGADNSRATVFTFSDSRLVAVSTFIRLAHKDASTPDMADTYRNVLESETHELTSGLRNRPVSYRENNTTRMSWQLEHETCNALLSHDAKPALLSIDCLPRVYILTFVKPPAPEGFRLYDLIFGQSNEADVFKTILENGWKHQTSRFGRETVITVSDMKMEGIADAEFRLFDNMLMTVKYTVADNYDNNESFYKVLSDRYGMYGEYNNNNLVWKVNRNTRDEARVLLQFTDISKTRARSITYGLIWLTQKKHESELFERRK